MPDPRETFDAVAELYDRIRHSYPEALFDELFSRLPQRANVLEVGPGTGQATRSLLARGARVTAVEPGANLAMKLRSNFKRVEDLTIVQSTFEDAPLAHGGFDALVSATAYHWVRGSARTEKPHDVLRPAGWIAIIDSIQVEAASDGGFFERVQSIYAKFGQQENVYRSPTPEDATSPVMDELSASSLFDAPTTFRYRWDQTYGVTEYGDLMRSYSSTQVMPIAKQEELIDEVSAIVRDEFNDEVTRPLVITLTIAQSIS